MCFCCPVVGFLSRTIAEFVNLSHTEVKLQRKSDDVVLATSRIVERLCNKPSSINQDPTSLATNVEKHERLCAKHKPGLNHLSTSAFFPSCTAFVETHPQQHIHNKSTGPLISYHYDYKQMPSCSVIIDSRTLMCNLGFKIPSV